MCGWGSDYFFPSRCGRLGGFPREHRAVRPQGCQGGAHTCLVRDVGSPPRPTCLLRTAFLQTLFSMDFNFDRNFASFDSLGFFLFSRAPPHEVVPLDFPDWVGEIRRFPKFQPDRPSGLHFPRPPPKWPWSPPHIVGPPQGGVDPPCLGSAFFPMAPS